MLRRRRSPAARWTVPTPERRRTWRSLQATCVLTAGALPPSGCAGPRSLRRLFPECAAPNHRSRLRGGARGEPSEACQERRVHEALDDLVVHLRQPTSDRRRSAVEPGADRFHDETLGLLVFRIALREQFEDPAGEHLLDGPIEGQRRELRR